MCISVYSLSVSPKCFKICVQMSICSDRRDGHGEMWWNRAGDGAEIVCVITVPHLFFFYRFELRYYMGQQVCLFLWQSEILCVCP